MRKPQSETLAAEMRRLAQAARDASRALGHADTGTKDRALRAAAAAIGRRADEILAENARDVEAARAAGVAPAMVDRLLLDRKRLDAIAAALLEVAALP